MTPGSQPCVGPEQHQIITVTTIIPGNEGIGDAIETEVHSCAVGHVVEAALDEGGARVFYHGQVGTGHGRKIKRQTRITRKHNAAGREWHIRR